MWYVHKETGQFWHNDHGFGLYAIVNHFPTEKGYVPNHEIWTWKRWFNFKKNSLIPLGIDKYDDMPGLYPEEYKPFQQLELL